MATLRKAVFAALVGATAITGCAAGPYYDDYGYNGYDRYGYYDNSGYYVGPSVGLGLGYTYYDRDYRRNWRDDRRDWRADRDRDRSNDRGRDGAYVDRPGADPRNSTVPHGGPVDPTRPHDPREDPTYSPG